MTEPTVKFEGLLKGCTIGTDDALRQAVEASIQRDLDPRIYTVSFTGHRVLVAKDRADAMFKGVIHKPERVRKDEENEMGSGWAISVGPLFGDGNAPHPGGAICAHPADILGKHVYFQMYCGKVFRTDEYDAEFESKDSLVVLTDRDIQGWEE